MQKVSKKFFRRSIIRFGDHNLFTDDDGVKPVDIPVEKIIRHPDYNPNNFKNDIAVIKLAQKVPFSSKYHNKRRSFQPQMH